jgi:diguanylate cyclase (GGDEF)-like protein
VLGTLAAAGLAAWVAVALPRTLVLEPGVSEYRLAPYFEVLEDPAKSYTIEQVSAPPLADSFRSVDRYAVSFGPSDSAYWLRFTVFDRNMEPGSLNQWLLDLSWDTIGSARLFTPRPAGDERGAWRETERGNMHQTPQTVLGGLRPFFSLAGPRGEPTTYYVRVESTGSLLVPAYIRTVERYLAHQQELTLFYGVYTGVLLSIALYNLLFYLTLRQRVYLYYVFYIVFTILYFLASVNMFQEWFLMRSPDLDFRLRQGLLSLAVLPCFAFTRSFLLTAQHAPRLDAIMRVAMVGWSVFVCLVPALPLSTLDVVSSLMGLISPYFFFAAGLLRYRAGFQPARFYTLAWGMLCVALSLYSLMHLGVVPPVEGVLYAVQAVSATEAILLSYALADRIRSLRQENEEARRSERRYKVMAVTDELTELYNARFFRAQLPLEMGKATSLGLPLSLVIMDIDDFKTFNDTYGHLAGDEALRSLGRVIANCVRDRDIACRYGGEEFSVILPATTAAEAFDVAERIRLAYQEVRRHSDRPDGARSVSAGVSELRPIDEPEAFLHRADVALYRAKHSGKDRVLLAEVQEL